MLGFMGLAGIAVIFGFLLIFWPDWVLKTEKIGTLPLGQVDSCVVRYHKMFGSGLILASAILFFYAWRIG